MKNRYRISEIAEIFGISRQTLIFYHKKNILVPFEIDEDNRYRYYSKDQLWDLMFILTLKRAGFSLEEIKSFSELRSREENIEFLENKYQELDKRIKELKKVKNKIGNRVKNLRDSLLEKEEKIVLKKGKKIIWYSISLKNPKDEREMVETYEKLDEIARENAIEEINYINMIGIKDIKNVDEDDIIPVLKLGILVPMDKIFQGCEKLKLEECFTISHKDSYFSLNDTYRKIDSHIEEKGYKNLGYSIELMKEVAISTEEGIGGIMEIMIPVIKNGK